MPSSLLVRINTWFLRLLTKIKWESTGKTTVFICGLFCIWNKWDRVMWSRLAWTCQSSCLSFPSVGLWEYDHTFFFFLDSFSLSSPAGSELVILILPSVGKQVCVAVLGSWIVTFVRGWLIFCWDDWFFIGKYWGCLLRLTKCVCPSSLIYHL